MKRRLMASVLLAGMVFSLPVYADDDRTPDEYDPNARFESPLTQQQPVIVNDRPARKPDDGDRFAEAAGRITQGAASGKNSCFWVLPVFIRNCVRSRSGKTTC